MCHKYLTVFLVNISSLLLGFEIAWGYLEPYFSSYLRYYNRSLTTRVTFALYSYIQYGAVIGYLAFFPISAYMGYREGL